MIRFSLRNFIVQVNQLGSARWIIRTADGTWTTQLRDIGTCCKQISVTTPKDIKQHKKYKLFKVLSYIDLSDSVNSVSLILGIKTLILYCNLASVRQSRHCETVHVLTHFQNSFNVITWKSFRGPSEQNYILICYLVVVCPLFLYSIL